MPSSTYTTIAEVVVPNRPHISTWNCCGKGWLVQYWTPNLLESVPSTLRGPVEEFSSLCVSASPLRMSGA